MNVGQLREDLAGIPGDLEVRVELGGRMVAAEGFHRYPRAVVLFESDPDEPHGGRPAGYIAPDESPADSEDGIFEIPATVRVMADTRTEAREVAADTARTVSASGDVTLAV